MKWRTGLPLKTTCNSAICPLLDYWSNFGIFKLYIFAQQVWVARFEILLFYIYMYENVPGKLAFSGCSTKNLRAFQFLFDCKF